LELNARKYLGPIADRARLRRSPAAAQPTDRASRSRRWWAFTEQPEELQGAAQCPVTKRHCDTWYAIRSSTRAGQVQEPEPVDGGRYCLLHVERGAASNKGGKSPATARATKRSISTTIPAKQARHTSAPRAQARPRSASGAGLPRGVCRPVPDHEGGGEAEKTGSTPASSDRIAPIDHMRRATMLGLPGYDEAPEIKERGGHHLDSRTQVRSRRPLAPLLVSIAWNACRSEPR